MNYVTRVVANDGGRIRYIKAREKGRDAWYIIELYPEHYANYKQQIKKGTLALNTFGTILASGWGTEAPDSVVEKYKASDRR